MTCLSCENNQEFSIIGGNSETITFDATNQFGKIVNLDGCVAFFSFTPYANRHSNTAIRKNCSITESKRGSGVYYQIFVELDSSDTVSLSGKYIFQLTVKDAATKLVFVYQGSMIIHKNIDESASKEELV